MADSPQTPPPPADAPPAPAPAPTFFSHQALSGVPWMLLSKLVLFVVYFLISVIVVRTLGPRDYGVYSLCKNISEYLVIACGLGLNAALLRFIPELCVNHNRAGLIRLLRKAAFLQIVCGLTATVLLWLTAPWLGRAFGVSFDHLLILTGVLVVAVLAKGFANDSLTAFFHSRAVAFLGVSQGVIWLALLVLASRSGRGIGGVLLAQILSFAAAAVVGGSMLVRHVRGLRWRSPPFGVGKRRVLKIASAVAVSSLVRMLMHKYTEVFFLGVFFTPAVVGIYDLGYSTPFIVISLIPSALQTLMTSGFAEAYTRDPKCLPALITTTYRWLILMVVPMAAFGVFFSPVGIVLVYGEEMAAAGPIAAAFCIFHALPLVSVPLSMAITAREKNLNMLPMLLLQVVINLALDVALIPRWGTAGGVTAVYATFLVTIPIRCRAVAAIIGGIYFPWRFLLRIAVPVTLLAALLSPLAPHLNLPMLLVLGVAYLAMTGVIIRLFRLIRPNEVAEVRALRIGRLNRIVDLLAGG